MVKSTPIKGKSQQSISSFFTKKAQTNSSQPPLAAPSLPPSQVSNEQNLYDVESDDELIKRIPSGRGKRALTEDANGGNSGMVERVAKRAKVNDDSSEFFNTTTGRKASHGKSKISPRTKKYLYTSSGQAAEATSEDEDDEQEREDPEVVKARKEELHRRFVKKLGHPDSLAQIRRRHWQSNEDSGALEDGDGEGDEAEEETAPKARKKGAKTGKLTPMEIQFLDIKRKHMDTVLIVEVGYKFKFFGEDARIAAKELSIVCIPGKFRFDERKS